MLNTFSHPVFQWDEETGSAICIITCGDRNFCGIATCAETDQDMKSEKVGCEIAYSRAVIRFLQSEKQRVKYQKQALEHLKSTIQNSEEFSKTWKRLCKEIHNLELDFYDAQEQIDMIKNYLREYINDKDALYKKIRQKRQGKIV